MAEIENIDTSLEQKAELEKAFQLSADEFYFQIENGIIVGYHDNPISTEGLPEGVSFVKLKTSDPFKYVGLESKYLGASKIPDNVPSLTELEEARSNLKRLFVEILFVEDIGDPNQETLRREYDVAKADYIALRDQNQIA